MKTCPLVGRVYFFVNCLLTFVVIKSTFELIYTIPQSLIVTDGRNMNN